jgi:hypothetical protein
VSLSQTRQTLDTGLLVQKGVPDGEVDSYGSLLLIFSEWNQVEYVGAKQQRLLKPPRLAFTDLAYPHPATTSFSIEKQGSVLP